MLLLLQTGELQMYSI